ncbi:macrophage mannose receptor 1-like [Xyrichtys novacula]|uniref:Macrophage mannose receptor 1-like n=1 Tax=Xyrichtys novacula TaxID=13765 RepID=A0AAV1HLR0_XYRNO|nr:macrophage mannose receptor 1-like [Xyrichtys novacula]
MERILLGLLCLSGWHFTSCLPHLYHYESEEKTWTEAQTFCRETYTDLVTVKSAEEVKQVLDTAVAHGNHYVYWIGVYTKIEWKWSDGYTASGADYRNWENIKDNEPDFYAGNQFCVDMEHDGKWWDMDCLDELSFICYRGTLQNPEFIFVHERMNWFDAQRFCRENYKDLATVRNSTENQRLHNTRPNSDWAWIGWRFTSCLAHQYYYVSEAKTWTEAQTFCREKYTDLATVKNAEEVKQLTDTVKAHSYKSLVWIGVYTKIEWKWSDGYTASGVEYMNWENVEDNEPDFYSGGQFCVVVTDDGRWWDYDCRNKLPSICGRGTPQGPEFVYIEDSMSWSDAQRFCRENYIDLATVRNSTENQKLQSLIPDEYYPWIGLYRDPDIHWSDGSGSKLSFWDSGDNPLGNRSVVCGAAAVQNSGKWKLLPCEEKHPFVCYIPEFAFVQESMNWTDAQRFCRENYIDLATVRNSTENQRLHNTRPNSDWAWIGLYRDPNIHWSDGSDSMRQFWTDYSNPLGNRRVMCGAGVVVNSGTWSALPCEDKHPFVCYSSGWDVGSSIADQYYYVSEPKNWTEAQTFCRDRYVDLATVKNAEEVKQLTARVSSHGYNSLVWIGLYSKIEWKWSDGYKASGAEYMNWANIEDNEPDFAGGGQYCVVVTDDGKWWDYTCRYELSFFCYRGWHVGSSLADQYYYVSEPKNWTEAQTFCRETYTDLVTVKSAEEVKQLTARVSSHGYNSLVWIGLYIKIEWKWSDGYTASGAEYMNWENIKDNEPDFSSGDQFCVDVTDDGRWWDDNCYGQYPFICYRGTPHDPEFVYIEESMNWFDAQRFCRENYKDLATVRNSTENQKLQSLIPDEYYPWIGLYRNPNIHWSDGSNSSFQFWASGSHSMGSSSVMCGAAAVQDSGAWWALPCEKNHPFMCYSSGWKLSPCLARQYHYVADPMNWTEAQTFCRETYTDLATIESPEELKQVNNTVLSSGLNSEVWIGLYSQNWRWSDSYTGSAAEYRKWAPKQPDNVKQNEYCVSFDLYGWHDALCSYNSSFFCYQGKNHSRRTQEDPRFILVSEGRNWSNAQRFCRENFIDLATVRNLAEHQKILSLMSAESHVWIGLYRDPYIHWSDGSSCSFRYWDMVSNPLGSRSAMCGVADVQRLGKLRFLRCGRRFPFVCYSSSVKRRVIKLKMSPGDPSVDLNNPAVKADILKKLQNRLKDEGLIGVTLKWREQPDEKAFHKEGISSLKKKKKKELCN